MASADKSKKKGTPGRTKRTRQPQFFDRDVGRITGVTLRDTGVRDEHGMEPIDNIFSSPVSPPRAGSTGDARLRESSGPDVDATLVARRTPRLPPPRATTPRHTNVGSPKRMSTGKARAARLAEAAGASESVVRVRTQPTNRVLDFAQEPVQRSVESLSPFRPRNSLRRSVESREIEAFASPRPEATIDISDGAEDLALPESESPLFVQHGDHDDAPTGLGLSFTPPDETAEDETEPTTTSSGRKSSRKSGASLYSNLVGPEPVGKASARSSSKRNRLSLDSLNGRESSISHASVEGSVRPLKKSRLSNSVVHLEDSTADANIDPSLLALGDDAMAGADESIEEPEAEIAAPQKSNKGKGRGRGRPRKDQSSKSQSTGASRKTVPVKGDAAKSQTADRGGSVGPSSAFALRATTPFEDAGGFTRSGRPIIGPLKYWANERITYKHGQAEGIIRADAVEPLQAKKTRRKTKKTARASRQDEDSETESVIADAWEAELGVISGDVANWDPESNTGDAHDLIHEDLAYAQPSLCKREIGGTSNFRYSKVVTTPFFGAGVVELPPAGVKRTKNARWNHLAFFVHKGKVMVEVNAPGNGAPPNRFAISGGGVWIVPRGNDYSITNESQTSDAIVFFGQGSEVQQA